MTCRESNLLLSVTPKQIADVEYDETQVTETQIAAAVERAGYTLVLSST
ncbi:MAG: hypothetical protein JXB07_02510 [Anaerolineae bacterium]|nr:hypothetical protein [Anaerolineae bacterium]